LLLSHAPEKSEPFALNWRNLGITLLGSFLVIMIPILTTWRAVFAFSCTGYLMGLFGLLGTLVNYYEFESERGDLTLLRLASILIVVFHVVFAISVYSYVL
jgi:hypothetical protein